MIKKTTRKLWINAFFRAIVGVIALIAYGSTRDWFVEFIGNVWLVGFFEGIVTMAIIYYYADKYGEAVYEIYLGLRELGRLRKNREGKK